MPLKAGDVIRVPLHAAGKPKRMICVCPKTYRYLVINTDPYVLAPTAQLRVSKKEIPNLETDSHIDTSKFVTLSKMETDDAVEKKPSAHHGCISGGLKKKIKEFTEKHGIMPADQEKVLKENF